MKTSRFFTMIILAMSVSFTAYAQEDAAEDAAAAEESSAPEKVDMKDLEKKYWAPSDQGYTVVQDRTYSKSKKFGVSLLGGPVLMYDFHDGFNFGLAASYHFNERWGVEASFMSYSVDQSETVDQVEDLGGTLDRGKVKMYYGISGRWVPFYSKMSFLGSKIVYFDMSFGLNLGMMQYEQQTISGSESQSGVAFGFDISQTYFITPKFAFRVDYAMKFFNEEVVKFNPASPGADPGSKLSDVSSLNVGLTYYF